MLDLEKIRERIITLNESDAKSILMLTAANIQMVRSGNGGFTSDNCIDEIIKLYNSIPEPKKKKEDGQSNSAPSQELLHSSSD